MRASVNDELATVECIDCQTRLPLLWGVLTDDEPAIVFFAWCFTCFQNGDSPNVRVKVILPLITACEAVENGLICVNVAGMK